MAVAYHEPSAKRNPFAEGISLTTLNRALAIGEHAVNLYIHMATLTNEEGKCWPTIAELCDRSDLSKNTVKKYLALMEGEGLFVTTQKGQWKSLPTIYDLGSAVVIPSNIVNFVTPKGSNSDHVVVPDSPKGSNDPFDPWIEEAMNSPKGSIAEAYMDPKGSMTAAKGVNDSAPKGSNPPPHPPSSFNTEIITTTRSGTVDYLSRDFAEWMASQPRVVALAKQYGWTRALVVRSLVKLQAEKFATQIPKNHQHAINRAAGWLPELERGGTYDQWRKEAPYEMAGVQPR